MPTIEHRLFIRSLVNTPPPPPPTGFQPYIGVSARTTSNWDDKQGWYSPASTRYFFDAGIDWNDSFMTHFRANAPAKQALHVSFKNYSQAALDTFLNGAKAETQRQYYITFHHEPENDVASYPASQYCTDNANVRKRWVAAGKPANVWVVSTLMGYTFRTSGRNPDNWYIENTVGPDGETYRVFDALFADQYDPGYKNNTYSDFASMNTEFLAYAKQKQQRIGFGELGSALGPSRTTNLTQRRAQIKGTADWIVANGGLGVGQVVCANYWDVQANKNWGMGTPEYNIYGAIPKQDYRLNQTPVLLAESPGSRAGLYAYSPQDTPTGDMWKSYCQASRAYYGIS